MRSERSCWRGSMLCSGFRDRSGVSDERRGLSNQPLRSGGLLTNFEVITESTARHRFPRASLETDCAIRSGILLTKHRVDLFSHGLASVWLQVAHGAFHVGMPHPKLHSSQIYAAPQRPGGKRCAELVQPEVVGIQLSALCDHFAGIKEVQLWLPAGCREQERTARVAVGFPFLQCLYKLVRDGNLAAFVGFWREAVLAFIADSYDSTVEVKIGPRGVHHFLLPHAGHQKELEPQALVLIACSKEFVEVFALVDFRFVLNVTGPVVLAGQAANAIGLKKGHHIFELVVDGARLKFFYVNGLRVHMTQC